MTIKYLKIKAHHFIPHLKVPLILLQMQHQPNQMTDLQAPFQLLIKNLNLRVVSRLRLNLKKNPLQMKIKLKIQEKIQQKWRTSI